MRLRNNALRLWRKHWKWLLLAVVTLVVFIASIQMWIWGSELLLYQQFDLTLKIIGGLLATGAISVAYWRTRSAEKGQYSDRFAKAVEQIASDQLAIRLGGLASIEALSKETEGEFIRVWTYLGEFLRYPPELAPWRNEEQEEPLGQRPDIAAVAAMLRSYDKTHKIRVLENELPLEKANLPGAALARAELHGAILVEADLQGANLYGANLIGAILIIANLQGADLQNATLALAILRGAELQDAELHGADLHRADLHGANLHGAELHGAELQCTDLRETYLQERELQQLFSKDDGVLLKEALFSLDALKEALHIKNLMPEKMSDVYYDASDGHLPDDWPDDKPKPRRITFEEWVKIRDGL